MVICIRRSAHLHMAQLMSLPFTISCSSKSRLVLPSWFYLSITGSPASPGQSPEGREMVVVVVVVVVVAAAAAVEKLLLMLTDDFLHVS